MTSTTEIWPDLTNPLDIMDGRAEFVDVVAELDTTTSVAVVDSGSPLFDFRRMDVARMAEAKNYKPEWLVRGLFVDRTFGVIAGPKKSAKSWFNTALGLHVATGTNFLGEFEVVRPGPVLYLTGESGFELAEIRAARYCESMGLDFSAAAQNFLITDQIAPATSPLFRDSLQAAMDDFQPVLVLLDPWYSYNSGGDSGQVTEIGPALAETSKLVNDCGATLLISHHFNSTGSGVDLDRITGAGFAEWAASWVLLRPRVNQYYDSSTGKMLLRWNAGSRSAGVIGKARDWTFSEGVYDEDAEVWVAPVSSELTEITADSDQRRTDHRASVIEAEIIQVLTDKPWELTKTELKGLVSGKGTDVGDAIDRMARRVGAHNGVGGEPGQLETAEVLRTTASGQQRTTTVYGLSLSQDPKYPSRPV